MSQNQNDGNPVEQMLTDALRVFSRSMNEMAKDMAPAGAAFWRAMTGMPDADAGPGQEGGFPPEPPVWSVVVTRRNGIELAHMRVKDGDWVSSGGQERAWSAVCKLDANGTPTLRTPEK